MASIPTYQQPRVEEQALPGARQQGAPAGAFQAPDYLGAAAKGLNNLGNEMAAQAADFQQKQDTATGTQLSAKLLNDITDFKIAARKRQGDLANGLPEEADKFYAESTKKLIDSAPNDRVKQYLQTFAAQQQPSFRGYIGSHAAEQLDKAQDAGFEAHNISLINSAAVDPSIADANLKDLMASVRAQLLKRGITDPDQVNNAVAKASTELHAGVINTLLVHDPKGAAAYYGTHKDGIVGEVRTRIEKTLEVSGRIQIAQQGADQLMDAVRTGAMTYDQAEAEARKNYSGEERTGVIQELRSQKSEFEYAKNEAEKVQFDPVNRLLGDYTVAGKAIPRSLVKETLQPLLSSPEAYAKAAKLIDQHNDEIRSEGNAAVDRARALASNGTDKALIGLQLKYDMVTNPDKWRNADLNRVLLPLVKDGSLKASDAEEAINMQVQLKKPVKSPETASLMTASQHLENRLETAVIDGKAVSGMKPAEKALVKAKALQTLEPLLQEYQARTGEKAQAADVKKIVDSVFVDKRYRNTFLGITYSDVKTETTTDFANAPMKVRAQMVSKIPPQMRRRIESALKTNGYEVTTDNILEAYQAGK